MADASAPKQSLPHEAYEELPEGVQFPSVIPSSVVQAEFTFKAILTGIIIGVVFGAANAYLGLQAGLTISTSIPVAVMTVAAFRGSRNLPNLSLPSRP